MTISEAVDAAIKKILESKKFTKLATENPYKELYEGILSNSDYLTMSSNIMGDTAKSFVTLRMTNVNSEEELHELLKTRAVATPLALMVYLGYLIGQKTVKSDSGVAELEKMFNLGSENIQ